MLVLTWVRLRHAIWIYSNIIGFDQRRDGYRKAYVHIGMTPVFATSHDYPAANNC